MCCVLACLLAGCGLKGDLYVEEEPVAEQATGNAGDESAEDKPDDAAPADDEPDDEP